MFRDDLINTLGIHAKADLRFYQCKNQAWKEKFIGEIVNAIETIIDLNCIEDKIT